MKTKESAPAPASAAAPWAARLCNAAFFLAILAVIMSPFGEGSALPGWQALLQSLLLLSLAGALFLRADPFPRGTGALLLLAASAVASSFVAANLYGAVLRTLDVATFVAAFLIGGLLCAGETARLRLVRAIVLAGVVQAILALVQLWGPASLPRGAGTMLNPNHFAALLGVSLLLGIGQLSSPGGRERLPLWMLLIPAAGFLIPASRGAILGLASGAVVLIACLWACLWPGLTPRLRRAVIAAGCVAILAAGSVLAWRFTLDDKYRWDRPAIWEASLAAWGDAPSPEVESRPALTLRLLGIGPGQFEREAPGFSPAHDDQPVRFGKRLDQTHSDPLQILVEQGILGALAGLLLLIVLARAIAGAVREERDETNRRFLAGCAGALTALGVHSLFENLSHRPALVLIAGLIAGIAAARRRTSDRAGRVDRGAQATEAAAPGGKRPATLLLGAGVAAFIFCACIAGPWLADRHWQKALADPAGGMIELDRAIAINRFQPAYHARRAAILAGAPAPLAPGQFAAAMAELDEAVRLDPRSAVWQRDRAVLWRRAFGEVFHDRSSFDASVAAYARAEALDPRDPFTPMQRGTLLASAAEYDPAAAAFARAREIEPNLFAAWLLGARLDHERGNDNEAAALEAEAHRRREALASYSPESDNAYEKAVLDWPDESGVPVP